MPLEGLERQKRIEGTSMGRMTGKVHRYNRYIIVDIDKPIFDYADYSRVRVDEKYIKEASLTSKVIVVRTVRGEQAYFPKTLKKVGKKVKEVFLYENNPMTMYELDIPNSMKKEDDFWAFS